MYTYTLHPVLGALCWACMELAYYGEKHEQIARCWRVLWTRQYERRGLAPMTFVQVLADDNHYAWRGHDGYSGGDVLGL